MEEDIKILEDVLKDKDTKLWIGEQGIQAIENLIARYKELKTYYEIICDDLEEHNLIYTDTPEFTELDNALRNLIARYKELEKHYQHEQEYINGEVFSAKQMHYIEDNYIDKSKIQEKIEELGKLYNLTLNDSLTSLEMFYFANDYVLKLKNILQELLED